VTSQVFISLRVPADPARAFTAFTQEIGMWWQPDPLFQLTAQGDGQLAFEPGPERVVQPPKTTPRGQCRANQTRGGGREPRLRAARAAQIIEE